MATMQFEYDPERLIEEVKKRPGIWDFENIEYRTKAIRHKLWTEVVNELMTSDVKVSKSEMRELGIVYCIICIVSYQNELTLVFA